MPTPASGSEAESSAGSGVPLLIAGAAAAIIAALSALVRVRMRRL
jgi:hypothetical protein